MEIGACGTGNLVCDGNSTSGGSAGRDDVFGESTTGNLYRHSLWAIVVLIVAYMIVLLLGIVGNSIVIAIVIKTPRMRTVTNLFITNLAFADLLVLIFCLPATLFSNIYVPWILGWFLCKTVPYVQGVTVCASVYSLVAISMDRFLVIWFPLRSQITKEKALVVIVMIWLWAAGLALPWVLYFDLAHADSSRPTFLFCVETWPAGMDGNAYFVVVNLIMFYLLPLGIISLCYFFIWFRVWRLKVPEDSETRKMALVHEKSKLALLKMLMVVVLVFIICWLPLYVIWTRLKVFTVGPGEKANIAIALPIAQWMGASNSCINPILYAFFNIRFRRAFFKVLRECHCTCELLEDMREDWSGAKPGAYLRPTMAQRRMENGKSGGQQRKEGCPGNKQVYALDEPSTKDRINLDVEKCAAYFNA